MGLVYFTNSMALGYDWCWFCWLSISKNAQVLILLGDSRLRMDTSAVTLHNFLLLDADISGRSYIPFCGCQCEKIKTR